MLPQRTGFDHGPGLVGDPRVEGIDTYLLDADLDVAGLARAARGDIDARHAGLDPPPLRDEQVDGMRDVIREAMDRARRGSSEHATADLAGDRVVQRAVGILSALHGEVPGDADDLPGLDQGGDNMGISPDRQHLIVGQEIVCERLHGPMTTETATGPETAAKARMVSRCMGVTPEGFVPRGSPSPLSGIGSLA